MVPGIFYSLSATMYDEQLLFVVCLFVLVLIGEVKAEGKDGQG